MNSNSEIRCTQGAMLRKTLTIQNADGTGHDVMGYDDIQMQVRKKHGSTVVFEATLADGLTRSTNTLEIVKEIAPDVASGVYSYDIDFFTTGNPAPTTSLRGRFIVDWEVTLQPE